MGKFIDLTGQKFGRLTVIEPNGCDKCGAIRWVCECDCGGSTVVRGSHLINGKIQSCGCERWKRKVKHGMTNTKEYREWANIKTRCYNHNRDAYDDYGGRGIQMCDVWKDDFQAFYDFVSKLPNFREPGYTLDRVDTNGDYTPENVRWADWNTQCNNRRNNVFLTHEGETHTIAEWSKMLKIPHSTLRDRIAKGWSSARVLGLE